MTKTEFAEVIGRPVQVVSEIINGHKEITAETAAGIAVATGTEATTWLNLQNMYRLWQLQQRNGRSATLNDVVRRARLAALAPVREMRERGLLSGSLDDQERRLSELYQVDSLDQPPAFAVAARRTSDAEPLTPAQTAWLACVFRFALDTGLAASPSMSIRQVAASLTTTIGTPDELAELPSLLTRAGVTFVYLPAFKGSRIDGAAFLSNGTPVVAVSGRIARFDSVLFTVLHELAHIELGHIVDGYTIDDETSSGGDQHRERAADELAARWAVGENFRPPGILSRKTVSQKAETLGVHPSIVVGRLQRDGKLPCTHLNNLVPRVRDQLQRMDAASRGQTGAASDSPGTGR